MMDAVEFLKEEDRMCDKYKYSSGHNCSDCPCNSKRNGSDEICIRLRKTDPAKYVEIVEKWSKEHSVKTRQSEFLKMFPNARINSDGVIDIDPCLVDKKTFIVIAKNMMTAMNAIKNTGSRRSTNAENRKTEKYLQEVFCTRQRRICSLQ